MQQKLMSEMWEYPTGLCDQRHGDPFVNHPEDAIEGRTFEERDEERDDLVDLFGDCSLKVFTGRLPTALEQDIHLPDIFETEFEVLVAFKDHASDLR